MSSEKEIDRIIHEPARLKIMLHLYMVERADFVFLMHRTGLSKGNLSSHLSKLEQAGYVKIDKTFEGKFPKTFVSLTKDGRTAFLSYRETISNLLKTERD